MKSVKLTTAGLLIYYINYLESRLKSIAKIIYISRVKPVMSIYETTLINLNEHLSR